MCPIQGCPYGSNLSAGLREALSFCQGGRWSDSTCPSTVSTASPSPTCRASTFPSIRIYVRYSFLLGRVWMGSQYNQSRKLTVEQVLDIRLRYAVGDREWAKIGRLHDVNSSTVRNAALGMTHRTCPWRRGNADAS
jgi:hypothetical protein